MKGSACAGPFRLEGPYEGTDRAGFLGGSPTNEYVVREFVASDYDAIARIGQRISPDLANSAEEIRHFWEAFAAPHLDHLRLVAETPGERTVVAWGSLEQRPLNHVPGKYWVEVVVDPEHRRQGLGQRLYDQLETEAARRGARGLWATARAEDPASLAFFQRQGFLEQRRVWRSRLELANANLAALGDRSEALARAGIRFTTLAEEGADRDDVRRRYYTLQSAAGRDVPVLGSHSVVSYEQFLRLEFDHPGYLPEATFFAESGGRYVGVTSLDRPRRMPEELHVGFTGVLREFRGQGIAIELKRRSILYAREHGYRTMRTGNDSLNLPIRSINERLGFRPVETMVHGEKSLEPAGPGNSVEGADRA